MENCLFLWRGILALSLSRFFFVSLQNWSLKYVDHAGNVRFGSANLIYWAGAPARMINHISLWQIEMIFD